MLQFYTLLVFLLSFNSQVFSVKSEEKSCQQLKKIILRTIRTDMKYFPLSRLTSFCRGIWDWFQRHRVVIPTTFRKTSHPNMEYKPTSIVALLLVIFIITLLGYRIGFTGN